MNRLKAMLYKEFIQLRRDITMLRLLVMLPIVQIIIFGLAIDTDVKHIPTVVFDQCRQEESRELLDAFTATNYYDIKYTASNLAEVNDKINSGQAVVGIVFPPDMVRDITASRRKFSCLWTPATIWRQLRQSARRNLPFSRNRSRCSLRKFPIRKI